VSKAHGNKVRVTAVIDPDVHQALQQHCRNHPYLSKSQVVNIALRNLLTGDHQRRHEQSVERTLDKLWERLNVHEDTLHRELRTLREIALLHVLSYYQHTPPIAKKDLSAAKAAGQTRMAAFMRALNQNTQPGRSLLEWDMTE